MTAPVSLRSLVSRFRVTVAITWTLVVLEAILELLLPLLIGVAINDLLEDSYTGLIWLAALGTGLLLIGSLRRLLDTRGYARMYSTIATEMVERERGRETPVSATAARATLLTEFVEFMENSMPLAVTGGIGIVGTLVILAPLNLPVFFACLGLAAIVLLTFWASSSYNLRLNAGYNDELERQVEELQARDIADVRGHFTRLMKWNRQLSDLETANFLVVWLGVIALLVFAPVAVIEPGETEYGFAFAVLMYVFQFIDGLATFPVHIQQAIRLHEISGRLSAE